MGELSVIQVVIVLVIALLVFGPARLPELGRQLGKGLRELKQQASGLGADLQRAVDDTPAAAPAPSPAKVTPHSADDDQALLAGVVVTHDEPLQMNPATPVVAGTQDDDDLLQGVVVSGDAPAPTAPQDAPPPS
jgi:sec-independent protein translocase protein TatA